MLDCLLVEESGRYEVYVQSYPSPGAKTQVSVEGGSAPAWSGNGRELFFTSWKQDVMRMKAVEIVTDPVLRVGMPRQLFEGGYIGGSPCRGYDVTPDGQRFLMVGEGEPPPHEPVTQINVVLNWFEELKRRVPVE